MRILLTTLHAKYVHASLALPYLAAACEDLAGVETAIREYTVNEPPERVLRAVIAVEADVVAFSCYIWNVEATLRLASDLKKVRPETIILLGGPEVSYGTFELMERNPFIDFVIRGEGEETFRAWAESLWVKLHGKEGANGPDGIDGLTFRADGDIVANSDRVPLATLDVIPSPFAHGLVTLDKPLVYYETSRGCPFSCAFCMSSLEKGVRSFSMDRIRSDLGRLLAAETATIKFVDRTFNYNAERATAIWEFILAANRGSRCHFEIAADLLTDANLALLGTVPPGLFRFEIGVQSGKEETLARVGRKSDLVRLFANVRRLVTETGIVVHLDLVAGLPGEDYQGFLASLQQLFDALRPDDSGGGEACCALAETGDPPGSGSRPETRCHIQVEPLKVLKGSPMRAIAATEGYAFSATPPYQILRTPSLTFAEIGRITAIARLLDLFFNSGRFAAALELVRLKAALADFFDHCARRHETDDTLAELGRQGSHELFWHFAECFAGEEWREELRDALCFDFCRHEVPAAGRLPAFFAGNGQAGTWGKGEDSELLRGLEIAPGSRVRTFTRRFVRDYTHRLREEGPATLTFVYASAPGMGLRVYVRRTG
jgi:anaerobic magnesium-protoporphyrin IX monomethyl ester cyclase